MCMYFACVCVWWVGGITKPRSIHRLKSRRPELPSQQQRTREWPTPTQQPPPPPIAPPPTSSSMARTSPAATRRQSQSGPATGLESPWPEKSNATSLTGPGKGRREAAAAAASSSQSGRKHSLQKPLACAKSTTAVAAAAAAVAGVGGVVAEEAAEAEPAAAFEAGRSVFAMYDSPRAVTAEDTVRVCCVGLVDRSHPRGRCGAVGDTCGAWIL